MIEGSRDMILLRFHSDFVPTRPTAPSGFIGTMPVSPLGKPARAAHGGLPGIQATMSDTSRSRKVPPARPIAAIVSLITATATLLLGCSPEKDSPGRTPSPDRTSTPAAASPRSLDSIVIRRMPSIVPFVSSVLKTQGIDLPLEANKSECHPEQATYTFGSGSPLQACRWHPQNASGTRYRLLSVIITMENTIADARQHVKMSTASREISPGPIALGDEATAGAEDIPSKPVSIAGKDQNLDISGAGLAIRVHNICIDIDWMGATYTVDSRGAPQGVVGLSRKTAIRQTTVVARSIIEHIG